MKDRPAMVIRSDKMKNEKARVIHLAYHFTDDYEHYSSVRNIDDDVPYPAADIKNEVLRSVAV